MSVEDVVGVKGKKDTILPDGSYINGQLSVKHNATYASLA